MNGRFPYAKVFTTFHMIMATLLSLLLYKFAPSLYPSMDKARANWKAVLKFMVPLGCLFAMNLYLSNKALQYCTPSFVQFCKEGNVALMFALACLIGLQAFTWYKVRILSIVMLGCALCAHGEPEFAMKGFLLQISAQVAECVKNLIGEVVMSGSGELVSAHFERLECVCFERGHCHQFEAYVCSSLCRHRRCERRYYCDNISYDSGRSHLYSAEGGFCSDCGRHSLVGPYEDPRAKNKSRATTTATTGTECRRCIDQRNGTRRYRRLGGTFSDFTCFSEQ